MSFRLFLEATEYDLLKNLKILQSSMFLLYWKAHTSHWFVVGSDFTEKHELFGELYDTFLTYVDEISEQIRALDAYPCDQIFDILKNSILKDDEIVKNDSTTLINVLSDDISLIINFIEVSLLENTEEHPGLNNYLQDLLDKLNKHQWMLKSIMRNQ